MRLYTFAQACTMLGKDPKTMRRWLAAAQIEGAEHPDDRRVKQYTRGELATVAQRHQVTLQQDDSPGLVKERGGGGSPTARALRAEVAELRGQVERLQREIEELRTAGSSRTPPHTPRYATPLIPSVVPPNPSESHPTALESYAPVRIRTTARPARPAGTGGHSAGHHPPLPDGWVAWIRFAEELGIPGTTGRRYVKENVIPYHAGEWDSGVANRPYEYALSPEQQEEARRIIRRLRPRSPTPAEETD